MVQSKNYKSIVSILLVIVCITIWISPRAFSASEGTKDGLRWDQQRVLDYPIYKLLLKDGNYGSSCTSESFQWGLATKKDGKPFVDPKREQNLNELLSHYPNSEYADDAALLLARARFFYHDDLKGAIEGLYKVISNYPRDTWIAEDKLFLIHGNVSNEMKYGDSVYGWYGEIRSWEEIEKLPAGINRDGQMERRIRIQEEKTYCDHLDKYPNLTSDEAHFWIGELIILAEDKERYNEAISNFQYVIDARKKDKRAEIDYAASQQQYGSLIWSKFLRTERECHRELINLYIKMGKFMDAKKSAEDYLSLYKNHPACNFIQSQLDLVNKELSK